MSRYTVEACQRRAQTVRELAESSDHERLIDEHTDASCTLQGDEGRIAAGFALIAVRRRDHELWRAEAYARLARGEDITVAHSLGPAADHALELPA